MELALDVFGMMHFHHSWGKRKLMTQSPMSVSMVLQSSFQCSHLWSIKDSLRSGDRGTKVLSLFFRYVRSVCEFRSTMDGSYIVASLALKDSGKWKSFPRVLILHGKRNGFRLQNIQTHVSDEDLNNWLGAWKKKIWNFRDWGRGMWKNKSEHEVESLLISTRQYPTGKRQ
jgi:hypothetical protein